MIQSSTSAILAEILFVTFAALLIAVPFYNTARLRFGIQWRNQGDVPTDEYRTVDGIVAGLFAIGISYLVWSSVDLPKVELNSSQYAGNMWVSNLFFVTFISLVWLYLSKTRQLQPIKLFGLLRLKPVQVLRKAVQYLLLTILVAIIGLTILHLLQWDSWLVNGEEQDIVQRFKEDSNWLTRLTVAFSAIIVAPLTEELLFRGFFYAVCKRFTTAWFAALITSILFACVHGNIASIVPLVILSLGFTFAYEKTGCLWVPVVMHMLFNALNVSRMVLN